MFLSVVFYITLIFFGACGRAPAPQRALPDFSLTAVTVDGTSPLDLAALRGRAWIADFVYTRCAGPCPMLSANMASLQKRLPKSIGLLSFSVDPDHDSPEVLTVYARNFQADPQRWLFATGERAELERLFRDGFQLAVAASVDSPIGQNITHSTKFVLIDADGRIRGYYDGAEPSSLQRLVADAGAL